MASQRHNVYGTTWHVFPVFGSDGATVLVVRPDDARQHGFPKENYAAGNGFPAGLLSRVQFYEPIEDGVGERTDAEFITTHDVSETESNWTPFKAE
jgi:hypothetical protein